MNLSREDLQNAVDRHILNQQQADQLWEMLMNRSLGESRFNFASVIYYLGAFIILAAMVWLASLGNEQLGGFGLFFITLAYTLLFARLGLYLWNQTAYRVGGGVLCALAVCTVPLMIYGLEKGLDFWPVFSFADFDEAAYSNYEIISHRYWLTLEVGTAIAAMSVLYFVRFPFLMVPLMLALWFLTLDAIAVLQRAEELSDRAYEWVSLLFGIGALITAYILDKRLCQDFAFWGYLIGLMAMSGSLIALMMVGTSEWLRLGYAFINLFFLFLAILLSRQSFLVFGALGIFAYLCYLVYGVFHDSLLFPLVLSVLGVGVIYIGILYTKHQQAIQQALLWCLPEKIRKALPSYQTPFKE